MTLPMLQAYIHGYDDRTYDMQRLTVMTGYWASYYTNGGKKAKPLTVLLDEMDKNYAKGRSRNKVPAIALDQDEMEAKVAQFQEREERLRRYQNGE